MLSVGRIYAGGSEGGVPVDRDTQGVGRRRAPGGWRYLWEQVAEGAEDYYSADVARGEAPGRWCGRAAGAELGLSGEVTEEQMERVFGLLMHPTNNEVLGQAPRQYRSVAQRLEAAEAAHKQEWAAAWAQRETELVEAGACVERVDGELDGHRERAGEAWAEAEATIRRGGGRAAVAGFDLTCSPPKSVSVLWAAADREGREKIWRAHREGVAAALTYVEREASWSRVGYNGVRQVDTTGMVIASFDHRMSRAGDAQVHTHNAVLNRVRCDDGQWRALDGRALYQVAASAGAIYDRVREAALERELGVAHERRKADGPREIVGVDDELCRLFSSRRAQVEGRLAEMVAAYSERHGAQPSQWAVTQMSQWATLETRAAKERHETTEEALARWESQSRDELGRELADVWDQAMTAGATGQRSEPLSDDEALVQAVAAVDAEKATWTRYDLARQLTLTLHVDRSVDGPALIARVDRLVEAALNGPCRTSGVVALSALAVFDTPPALRRSADGESVYQQHGTERFSTDGGLARELRVLAAARRLDGPKIDAGVVEVYLAAEDTPIGGDQAAAARQVLTSGRVVEALVGPAGTGKTHTMGAVGRAWRAGGGAVLGLAVAETAARTLADEAGIATVNTAKLLFEHRERTAEQKAQPGWQQRWGIKAGTLVILDEAGMASRQVIDDVRKLCETAGAKLLLVGDHEQLDSPAAGGTFALVVDHVGAATLGEVRRFDAEWERKASLRLRAGDTDVLAEYDLRGRISGGGESEMEDAALTAALADKARGRRAYLLADTNDQAARLAGRVRDHLVAAGTVDDRRAVRLRDGNWAAVGDWIVTRLNDRDASAGGHFVANRDVWQVTAVADDGAVRAARVDMDSGQVLAAQEVVLDADYVARHVQLEYAGTVHAALGGTGGVAHAVVSERTSRRALYVAATRGVEDNHIYVVCDRADGLDLGGAPQGPLRVLAAILERDDQPEERAALSTRERSVEQARSLATLFPVWQDLVGAVSQQQWKTAIAAACGEEAAAAMTAAWSWPTLAARLRVIDGAGGDSAAILAKAASARPLGDAADVAAVLHWRLRHSAAAAVPLLHGSFSEISPTGGDQLGAMVGQVAAAMDARSDELGERAAADTPAWAAELGAPPAPGDPAGADWRRRAGIVAGYREAFGLDRALSDENDDPLGPMPTTNRADARAWWHRATLALGRTEPAGLAQLPDERLEAIVDQARQAETDAPPAVAQQLRTVFVELRAARTTHGQAIAATGADSPAAQRAAEDCAALAALAARLEGSQRRREQWRQSTSRLQAQGAAAAAELAARADARAGAPFRDTDTVSLQAEAAQLQQRLWAGTTVAKRHEKLADKWQTQADELTATMGNVVATRPHVSIANATVAAEQALAERMDDLQSQLGRGRLNRNLRGHARQELAREMAELVRANPALNVDPARRELRWAQIVERTAEAEQRWLHDLQAQLDEAVAHSEEHRAIARPAHADVNERGDRLTALRSEIERRTTPPAEHAPPTFADVEPHPGPVNGERVSEPDIGPVTTAVTERDRPLADADLFKSVRSQADDFVPDESASRVTVSHCQQDDTLGEMESGDQPAEAIEDRSEPDRRPDHQVLWDLDVEALQAQLARAEQQLALNTYVVQRYGAVRQRWQATAEIFDREIADLTDNHPYMSIAERNVASERAAAARIDELRVTLAPGNLGRTALRAARENLAEELNHLLNDHPGLRFDPVLREDRWTTILDRAHSTEQQRITDIRAQLDEAATNIAENDTIVTSATTAIEEQSDLSATLRAAITEKTPLASGANSGPKSTAAADTVTAAGHTEARDETVSATATDTPTVRHEQLQLPVDTRSVSEGLGGA